MRTGYRSTTERTVVRRRKPPIVLALVAMVALLLGLVPQAATADINPTTPVGRAATWLLNEADSGTLPRFDGTADWQLTSDAVLGLIAAGATKQQLQPFVNSLETAVEKRQYGYVLAGSMPVPDGGALAKLLVIAQATGTDATDFGGVDLARAVSDELVDGMLGQRRSPAGAVQSNTFGQAYVVLGLIHTRGDPRPAIRALLQQQCPAGDFRLAVNTTDCTSAATSADRDVTAIAIHALRTASRVQGMDLSPELDKAVAWLAADQTVSGSWVGSPSTPTANTNTTGLAARALAGVAPMAVSRAAGFTQSLQVNGGTDDGAVAYTAAALAAGAEENRFQWHRATTQALFALAHWGVYTVEGTHQYNGRQWRTQCEEYSQTYRCLTDIHATTVVNQGGKLVKTTGWTFNNLTYLPSSRSLWKNNPLGNYAKQATGGTTHKWSEAGRDWRVECDTAVSGRNGCRAYILSRFVAATQTANGTWSYSMKEDWVFNNIVMFN